MAMGAGVVVSSLPSCSTLPIVKTGIEGNKVSVDRASFTNNSNVILVRTNKLDYDILLVKTENSYRALYMRCTHNQTSLSSTKSYIFCDLHGAEFDFEGNVIKGPAVDKLLSFRVTESENQIHIHLS